MIALTQEQREELANYARERLASHVIHGGCSDEEDILKIALASLTAVPVGKFVLERIENRYHHIKHGEHQHTEPKYSMVKLFTTPPVPEIKLPKKREMPSAIISTSVGIADAIGWNKCLSEIKRLNGLGE